MNKKGFTLVELLAVVVILAMIMLIAIPNVMTVIEKGKKDGYLGDAKKFVYLLKYQIKKGKINKPAAEESVKVTLKQLATTDFSGDKDGYIYDENKSYVYVTRENGKIIYYVQLVADKSGNESVYRGILLVNAEELDEEEKYEKYYENITRLEDLTPQEINRNKKFNVGISAVGATASSKTIEIRYGKTANVTITPNSGYYLKTVSCTNDYTTNAQTGVTATGAQTITIYNNSSNHPSTCTFTASKITYLVTIKTTATQSSKSSIDLKYQGTGSIDITPNSGYYLDHVSCTNGYTTNAKIGIGATPKQTVVISNNGVKNTSECTFVSYPAYPTVTGGSTTWTKGTRTFTVTNPTKSSIITRYEYYISNSSSAPAANTSATGNFAENSVTIDKSGKYIFFRIIYANGVVSKWTSAQNLYVDREAVGAPTVLGGSTTWTLSKVITIVPPTSLSGIAKYEYYLSDSTTKPAASQTATASLTSATATIATKSKYIYCRVVNNVGTVGAWTSTENLYVDPNTYTIEYVLNGGLQASDARTKYNVETATFNLPTPTKSGSTFGGWYEASNFSGSNVAQIAKGTSGNKKYYAKWTANTYTVTLNRNTGTGGTASVTATYGSAMPSATAPTKNGYQFCGYYLEMAGALIQYYTKTMASAKNWDVAANTTLKAVWTEGDYTVTFDMQGGSGGTSSVSAYYDTAMTTITPPSKAGYTFGGYYSSTNGGGTKYYNADGTSARTWNLTSATTLYAKWTANTYAVTLNKQSGTGGTDSITATYGSAMPTITAPTRTGFTFGGYFSNSNGGGTKYYNANASSARTWNIASTTTLYANWTGKTYTVTLNKNNGTGGTNSVTTTYNSEMPSATAPTRTGYTFNGYYITISGSLVQYYTNTMASARTWNIDANSTLTASWTGNTYAITFNKQSGTGGTGSTTAIYGNAMPKITLPERTGYTFDGYYSSTNGGGTKYYNADGTSARTWNLTSATTLYAKWVAKTYTVILDKSHGNGGTDSVTATYGSAMPSATSPVRTGYTFNGYYTTVSGATVQYYTNAMASARNWNIASNASLQASWTAKTYTVTFDRQSGTGGTSSTTATYDSAMPAITVPTRTGYTFGGYYSSTGGSGTKYYNANGTSARTWNVASATTLYAKWTANTYAVTLDSGNYIYDLNNIGSTASEYMTYSVNNGTVTVKATRDDGYGFINARVYLTAGITYNFSCTSNGTWGSSGDTVEAFLMLNGSYDHYYRMESTNYEFTPTITGEYYLRLDSNKNGVTHTFSNIVIKQKQQVKTATYDSAMPKVTVPTRAGYTFQGYYSSTGGGGTKYYNADGTSARTWNVANAATLYAYWSINSYTLAYDFNSLNDLRSWYTLYGERFNVSYDGSSKMSTVSCASSSGWEILYLPITTVANKTYKLTFNYINPNGYTPLSGYSGIGVQALTRVDDSDNSVNSIKTAYLSTTRNTISQTITFEFTAIGTTTYLAINFGMASDYVTNTIKVGNFKVTETLAYNTAVTLPSFSLNGYTYSGWYDAASGGNNLSNLKIPPNNKTIYAQSYANTYLLTFEKWGGVGGTDATYATFGNSMPAASAPWGTGYTFGGYFVERSDGWIQYYNASMESTRNWDIAANTTLYPSWTANTYTIWFNRNGGAGGSDYAYATYDQPMPWASAPTRSGYTFDGYFAEIGGAWVQYYNSAMQGVRNWNLASNVTLVAGWTIKNYAASYNACSRKETEKYNCRQERYCPCDQVQCSCWVCNDCWGEQTCSVNCGNDPCNGNGSCCGCTEADHEVCDEREKIVDCSTYECPNGGTLNNTTHMCEF